MVGTVSAVLMGTVLVGGCAGSRDEKVAEVPAVSEAPVTSSSVVVATTTSSAVQSDEEAIIAAVHGYWEAFLSANNPPNPLDPGVEKYMTGEARERTLERISARQQVGQGIRLPPDSRFKSTPTVLTVDGQSASVAECLIDDSELFDIRTGEVLSSKLETFRFSMTLALLGGQWKVATNVTEQSWEGEAGCALAR